MKYKKQIIYFTLLAVCILTLYIFAVKTNTSFESDIEGEAPVKLATWNILLNNENITSVLNSEVDLNNINWSNTHAKKLAPGSKGVTTIQINPTTTNVAIKYEVTYNDFTNAPSEYVLTLNSLKNDTNDLIKTDVNTYTGIITLNDIKANKKPVLTLDVEWINDESNNDYDSKVGVNELDLKNLNLTFKATQYKGETIKEYIGE